MLVILYSIEIEIASETKKKNLGMQFVAVCLLLFVQASLTPCASNNDDSSTDFYVGGNDQDLFFSCIDSIWISGHRLSMTHAVS